MTTAGDYFATARDLMADGDPSRVTIDALCRGVGTTSGSFYHHFGSFDGFAEALAEDWVERVSNAVRKVTTEGPASISTVRRLVDDQLVRQPHHQEAAFRAWGRTNERIRAAVERVDSTRRQAGRALVHSIDPSLDAETAAAYADLSTMAIIGAQTHNPETAAEVASQMLAALASLIDRAGGRHSDQS